MADYDTREALQILATFRAAKFPQAYEAQRTEAAAALMAAVMATVRAAGFPTGKGNRTGVDLLRPSAHHTSVQIWVISDSDGVHLGYDLMGRTQERFPDPAIEFDPISGQWVGKTADTFIVAAPGEPIPRRSAVAVVAESIAAAIAKLAP